MSFRCWVCDGVTLSSEEQYADHLKGKRHQRQLDIQEHVESLRQRSLFVPMKAGCGVTEELLRDAFSPYGAIVDIDFRENKLAFVVFESADTVAQLLEQGNKLKCNGVTISYKEKKKPARKLVPRGAFTNSSTSNSGNSSSNNGNSTCGPSVASSKTASKTGRHTRGNYAGAKDIASFKLMSHTAIAPSLPPTKRNAFLEHPLLIYALPMFTEESVALAAANETSLRPDIVTAAALDQHEKAAMGDAQAEVMVRQANFLAKLGGQMVAMQEKMVPTERVRDLRRQSLSLLEDVVQNVVQRQYGHALSSRLVHVRVVGSTVTGLDRPTSDMDATVIIDSDGVKMSDVMEELTQTLRDHHSFTRVFYLRAARCPVLKAHCRETNMDLEITASNLLAVKNTELLAEYLRVLPLLRPLIRFLTTWACAINLQWTSYLWCLFVIRFMQVRHGLPSLQYYAKTDGFCDECTQAMDDEGNGPSKRHKETSIDSQEYDFRFCTHQREFHIPSGKEGVSFSSSKAFLAHLFFGILHSIQTWLVAEEKAVIDIAIDAAEGEDVITDNTLVIVDPFDRAHNVAQVISTKHARRLLARISEALDTYMRKIGLRLTFTVPLPPQSEADVNAADSAANSAAFRTAVERFCSKYGLCCRPFDPQRDGFGMDLPTETVGMHGRSVIGINLGCERKELVEAALPRVGTSKHDIAPAPEKDNEQPDVVEDEASSDAPAWFSAGDAHSFSRIQCVIEATIVSWVNRRRHRHQGHQQLDEGDVGAGESPLVLKVLLHMHQATLVADWVTCSPNHHVFETWAGLFKSFVVAEMRSSARRDDEAP